MQHVSFSRLAPEPRHARLFELIRQENLAAERASALAQRRTADFVAQRLQKAACASLRPRA